MEQWIIGLVPVIITTSIILVQIARKDGRDNQRMMGIEKELESIHIDVLRKDVFNSELNNITGKIQRIEDRVENLERKVFDGARP